MLLGTSVRPCKDTSVIGLQCGEMELTTFGVVEAKGPFTLIKRVEPTVKRVYGQTQRCVMSTMGSVLECG